MAKSSMNYKYETASAVTWASEGEETAVFDATSLNADIQDHILAYGLHHLLRDRTSALKDSGDKLTQANKIFSQFLAGSWKAARASSGTTRGTLLAQAIARLRNITLPEANEMVDGLPEENIKALRAHPEIKREIMRIKQEALDAAADNSEVTSIADLL